MIDSLFLSYPIWLEESGLPEKLAKENGVETWFLLQRLIAEDCQKNIFPDWFTISINNLSQWTGINKNKVIEIMKYLKQNQYIDVNEVPGNRYKIKIVSPLPFTNSLENIHLALQNRGISCINRILRYSTVEDKEEKQEQIISLYQEILGARISSLIIEDLTELAANFELTALKEAFVWANKHRNKSFSALINRLYQQKEEGKHAKDPGAPEGRRLPTWRDLAGRTTGEDNGG